LNVRREYVYTLKDEPRAEMLRKEFPFAQLMKCGPL
jgi:hypothetical protein